MPLPPLVSLSVLEPFRRAVFWCWVAAVATVTIASLSPTGGPPGALHIDKIYHFLGYGAVAGLPFLAFRDGAPAWRAALAAVPMGIVLELLQDLVPTRNADTLDIVANCAGVAAAVLLGPKSRQVANRWFPAPAATGADDRPRR